MNKNYKYITDTHKQYLNQLIKNNQLNNWELNFCKTIVKLNKYSSKQQQIVNKIFRKNNIKIPKNYSKALTKQLEHIDKQKRNSIKFKPLRVWEYSDRYSYRKKGKL